MSIKSVNPSQTARLHCALIRGLIGRGVCPSNTETSHELGISRSEIEESLRELAAIHGLVLHPHVCEPGVIHPFSLTPTIHWIAGESVSWWAPCMWCAFGVAGIVGGSVQIHSRFGGESESLVIPVVDGQPHHEGDIVVHFAIPPAKAWDNVHQHCSMVLPFRSSAHVEEWCGLHGIAKGEVVPLAQVADLARRWYGTHARPDWRKWTVAEAQSIFTEAGLTSPFWKLAPRSGEF